MEKPQTKSSETQGKVVKTMCEMPDSEFLWLRLRRTGSIGAEVSLRVREEPILQNTPTMLIPKRITTAFDCLNQKKNKSSDTEIFTRLDKMQRVLKCVNKRILRFDPLITSFRLTDLHPDGFVVEQLCIMVLTLKTLKEFRIRSDLSITSIERFCRSNLSRLDLFVVWVLNEPMVRVLEYLVRKSLHKHFLSPEAIGISGLGKSMHGLRARPEIFETALKSSKDPRFVLIHFVNRLFRADTKCLF